MTSIPEKLNRELVVRLVISTAGPHLISDRWALAYEIVRALCHWDEIDPEDMDARRSFLLVLEMGEEY